MNQCYCGEYHNNVTFCDTCREEIEQKTLKGKLILASHTDYLKRKESSIKAHNLSRHNLEW